MPRKGSKAGLPWYKKSHDSWHTTIGGKKICLAKGKDRYGQACQRLAELQGETDKDVILPALFDRYVQHLKSLESHKTRWFAKESKRLVEAIQSDLVANLTKQKLLDWTTSQTWRQNTKRDFVGLVGAALSYGVKNGLLQKSPLVNLRKPGAVSAASRQLITPAEHSALCQLVPPSVRDVFEVLFETGSRPINFCRAKVTDFSIEGRCLILAQHKTGDRIRKPLVVLLPTKSFEIVQRLVGDRTSGYIFKALRRDHWTTDSLHNHFIKARTKLGMSEEVKMYGYRHARATSLMVGGAPDAQVAAILGLTSTQTLHRHYSHICQNTRELLRILEENCSS